MEDNEKEVVDEVVEETQEEVNEEESVEEEADDSPTLEDYQKLKKERETLLAQKEHWRKKAEAVKAQPLNKQEIKETPTGLSREEAILIAKGVNEDIINQAAVVAKAKGINLMEAMKDPLIEAYASKIKADEKKEKAQLTASKGSGNYVDKSDLSQVVGMTEEEHRKAIGM